VRVKTHRNFFSFSFYQLLGQFHRLRRLRRLCLFGFLRAH